MGFFYLPETGDSGHEHGNGTGHILIDINSADAERIIVLIDKSSFYPNNTLLFSSEISILVIEAYTYVNEGPQFLLH